MSPDCCELKPDSWSDFILDINIFDKAETSCRGISKSYESLASYKTYHDTCTKAQRARKESIAILYSEVFLAGYIANDEVNKDYRCSEYACWQMVLVVACG